MAALPRLIFLFLLWVSVALAGTEGVFNGLVGTGEVVTGSAVEQKTFSAKNGFLSLNSTTNGRFTGTLRLEGKLDAFSGAWTSSNTASVTVVRAGKTPAVLALKHSGTVPGEVSGTVTVGGVALTFRALRGDYRPVGTIHPLGGRRYSILLPPPPGLAMGFGVATLFVGSEGLACLSGWLPNGQGFATFSRMVDDGVGHWLMPVYVASTGVFTGEIEIAQVAPATGSEVGGTLAWLKPPASAGAAGGFLKEISPVGTFHSALDAALSTGLGGEAFTLTLNAVAGGLSAPAAQNGMWPSSGKPSFGVSTLSGLSLGFTAPTGQFEGAFTAGKKSSYKGLLLSREVQLKDGTRVRGAGFYASGSGTGAVLLTSSAPPVARSANADLNGLVLSSGLLSPGFAAENTTYTAGVGREVSGITVTPTAAQLSAKVQVRVNDGAYTSLLSGQTSGALALKRGGNVLEVRVTAEDGVTVKKYTVSVSVPYVPRLGMVGVLGGTLPSGSTSEAQVVEDFQIGKYEVTSGEWRGVRDWAVSTGYSDLPAVAVEVLDNYPVTKVNWYDVVKWCNAKSEMEGRTPVYQVDGATYKTGQSVPTLKTSADGYRLPTDAEWEWAARGGRQTHGYTYSGGNDVNAVAWTSLNSTGGSKAVGTKAANELGIYDMSGNVSEWCWDPWLFTGYNVCRGGSWKRKADDAAVSYRLGDRSGNKEGYLMTDLGFRLACSSGESLSANAYLSDLSLGIVPLSPAFAAETTGYTASVAKDLSTIKVTSTVSQAKARIEVRVNDTAFMEVVSGQASGPLALKSGRNTLEVKVTAEDGVTVRTYIVGTVIVYETSAEMAGMVSVLGGTLPSSSELEGQTVGDFQIGKTEVTWGEWKTVRDWAVRKGYTDLASRGAGTGDNYPVEKVSWYEAVKWCNAKSEKEGKSPVYQVNGETYKTGDFGSKGSAVVTQNEGANGYRLPTEVEWEWAARGGRRSRWNKYSGSDFVDDVAWTYENSKYRTYEVGTKTANELGIYDMSGNVAEYCWDLDGYGYRGLRGGSCSSQAYIAAVSYRFSANPLVRWDGFRFACRSGL